MKERTLYIVIIFILLLVIAVGATYYLTTQSQKSTEQLSPTPTATTTAETQPQPTEAETTEIIEEETDIPEGWQTYTNDEYSFEISYPDSYQALDDQNNLYGWPNGIVLIYSGGQSYDLPIEVWNDSSEYESKYQTQIDNLTIKQAGNKYITLLNANQKAEVDEVIATFKLLK